MRILLSMSQGKRSYGAGDGDGSCLIIPGIGSLLGPPHTIDTLRGGRISCCVIIKNLKNISKYRTIISTVTSPEKLTYAWSGHMVLDMNHAVNQTPCSGRMVFALPSTFLLNILIIILYYAIKSNVKWATVT